MVFLYIWLVGVLLLAFANLSHLTSGHKDNTEKVDLLIELLQYTRFDNVPYVVQEKIRKVFGDEVWKRVN